MPITYQELIDQAVVDDIITPEQYLQIPWNERESMQYLFSYLGRQAVADGVITLQRYLQIPLNERESIQYLFSYLGQQAVADGVITLQRYLQIPLNERESIQYLFSYEGRRAVTDGVITLEQYLQIPLNERESMRYLFSYYQYLIQWHENENEKNKNRIIVFTSWRQSIAYRFIPLERYLQIPPDDRLNVINALRCPVTQERIIDGKITIADIIGIDPVRHHAHGAAVAALNINGAQSIHTASVHESVSESATRLANRYKSMVDSAGLESTIEKAKAYINNLPDDSEKNTAAKEGFSRIVALGYTFTDPNSQVSIKELVALAFLAIHDDKKRVGSLEDAKTQFVEALYEIQRGYNLSKEGKDDGKGDKPICASGTFSKIIEKLVGIHPDCIVLSITKEIASVKLPIVVREEAMRYLTTFANPNTAEALLTFTSLIEDVKKDGVDVIWEHIKDNIATRMFDEFGSLYRNITDPCFTAFVEAGKAAELSDLSTFQEQVQSSYLNKQQYDDSETQEEEDDDEVINPEEKFLVEVGKDVELDDLNTFQEIALQIALQLDNLENKAKNLRDRDHILLYCKAANIVRLLRSLNHDYFTEKKIDYKTYKEESLDVIHQERPELDKHRGYKQILGNLLILIATLGTGQLINKVCNGKFLFFNKTDSAKHIDTLNNTIEKMDFTCLNQGLS